MTTAMMRWRETLRHVCLSCPRGCCTQSRSHKSSMHLKRWLSVPIRHTHSRNTYSMSHVWIWGFNKWFDQQMVLFVTDLKEQLVARTLHRSHLPAGYGVLQSFHFPQWCQGCRWRESSGTTPAGGWTTGGVWINLHTDNTPIHYCLFHYFWGLGASLAPYLVGYSQSFLKPIVRAQTCLVISYWILWIIGLLQSTSYNSMDELYQQLFNFDS